MTAALLALLAAIANPGVVTHAEFTQAKVGMSKHRVQYDLWDAKGTRVVEFGDEVGNLHLLRDYPTPHAGTLEVEWMRNVGAHHFRLYRAEWPK
jgi:hypothetical protein